MKRRMVSLLCLIVLGPILPIYLLRASLQAVVDFIDWTAEGRGWSQLFVNASERIERYFRVDAESEYQDWRRRMKFKNAALIKQLDEDA